MSGRRQGGTGRFPGEMTRRRRSDETWARMVEPGCGWLDPATTRAARGPVSIQQHHALSFARRAFEGIGVVPGLTRRAYLGVLRVRARGHLLRARGEHARGSADGDDQIRSIRALDAQADVVELAGAELQELVRRHPSLDRVETRVQGIPDERRSGRDSVAHRGGGHAASRADARARSF